MIEAADAPVTFVVFTYNEADRIERVVRNLRNSGPVLVVDNHSTDDTTLRATALGARILLHRNPGWVEDEGTVAVVKAAIETPWIYWGYADEMLSQATLDHVMGVVYAGRHDIVSIARDNYYYGRYCHQAFAGGRLPRLFRKDAIDFAGNTIHRFGRITVPEERIHYADRRRYIVHHFISNTAQTYLRSYDRYTDVEATHDDPPHPLALIARSMKTFLGNYLLRGGYKAGREGFYFSAQMIYFDWLLAMKRFERQQGYNVAGIERRNNVRRDAILADQQRVES